MYGHRIMSSCSKLAGLFTITMRPRTLERPGPGRISL